MSFDVYVQRFRRGERDGIAPGTIRDAFPGLVVILDEDYWKLVFSDTESTDLFLQPLEGGAGKIHSLSFHRLGADPRLWQGIWLLLAGEGCVFHFPGGASALASSLAALDHLPAEMGANMGVTVVAGPHSLARSIADIGSD